MLINVTKDKTGYHVNHAFADNVPEFAALIETEGEHAMAFIVYLFDPAEDNPWSALPEEIRKRELIDSMELPEGILARDVVKRAAQKYEMFCAENTSYKLKASYEQAMHKVARFIGTVEELDHDTAKKFVDTLKGVPDLLKGKSDLEKMSNKEEQMRGKIRKGRKLSANEKMKRG